MRTVEFEYDLAARVLVIPIGMSGIVDSLSIDNNGIMYRVIYWNDGIRNSVWMYPSEIRAAV